MRSQTTSGSRKRGRESTPVRTTRLKTGGRHLLGLKGGGEDNDVVDFFGDGKTSPVIGPDGPTDQQQPPPSKNRKQQQQQVANGFPVTVFPPADNNNSPPPPGPFQSRHNNKNSSSSRVVAAAKATVRLDNNKPEPSAAAVAAVSRKVEAPPLGRRVDSDDASVRRQQMKEAFQPWVMQVRLRPQFLFFSFLLSLFTREKTFNSFSSRLDVWRRGQDQDHLTSQVGADRPHLKGRGPIERSRLV